MGIEEMIDAATRELTRAGVPEPRLDAELLMAHALKRPRLRMILEADRDLELDEESDFQDLLRRRIRREPLQHLVGQVWFCGCPISVNPSVLIPRPETEMMAEAAWTYLGQRSGKTQFLDWGTGSGCIAIAVAAHCPMTQLTAIDISSEALEVARQNAIANRVQGRIRFLSGDGFSAIEPGPEYDLIVSNPPYIPRSDILSLQSEVRDYDPHLALDGGTNGLHYYLRLAREGPVFLDPKGQMMVEFGDGQAQAVAEIFQQQGWNVEQIAPDLSGTQRFLIASQAG